MKQEIPIQQSKVTTPLSIRRKATGRRALLGNGAGGEAPSIPDCAITRCTCTEEDFDVDLVKGQQYDVHRFGDGYTIPELHMTFSWHYFVCHFG